MNKIHYILDLTGIRIPGSVKAETEKRINNAGALYEKKSGKKKAAVVLAFVFAFIMIVVSVAMITKTVNSNRPLIPEITETETGTDITETDAPDNNDEDEKYYVFDSLYKDYYRYDIFKTAVSLIKPYNNYLVTAKDLSPLYQYFGDNEVSADELCETFFAFYEKDCVVRFDGISDHSSAMYEKIGKEFNSDDQSLLFYASPDELRFEEIILMTAKNGTFEYLLTLPVNTANTYIYDSNAGTRKIGRITGGKYYISHQYMLTAEANVYKIRFEAGLPVIYAKYTIPQRSLILSGDNGTFFFGLGLSSEKTDSGNEKIVSGKFKLNGSIFEFKNEENDMISPVYTKRGMTASSSARDASLCDYPYSVPSYDEKNGLCSRKTVCDIINKYELQWFFPMYITSSGDGTMQIIGDGIKTGDEAYGTENVIYSTVYRLYGTAYENNIYTTYGGSIIPAVFSSTAPAEFPDCSVGLCYLPDSCDTPYFDRSYFDVDRKYMLITVQDNEIVTAAYPGNANTINSDMLQEYVSDPADVSSFEPMFTSDLPYIKNKNDKYFPSRPFDIKYLPLLSESIDTPKLFTELGLSVPEYEHLNSSFCDLRLGHREISVISIGTTKVYNDGYILDSSDAPSLIDNISLIDNKNGNFKHVVNAYEEINGYIIDMTGRVCGKAEQSGVYMFKTVDPCLDLTVKGKDGVVTYLSYYSDTAEERPENAISGCELLPTEEIYDVRADTLLYLPYYLGETAPAIDVWAVTYDEQSNIYTLRVNIMKLSNNKDVFGIKNKDKRIYKYYPDVSMIVEKGRVYWICTDDQYAHGFYQLFVEYNGRDVAIRVGMET